MKTDLYWFPCSLPSGQLGICPRPRGHDWLGDEIQHFKQSGVDVLVNALELAEMYELELLEESRYCEQYEINYLSYPIKDRHVPDSMKAFYRFTKEVANELSKGQNVIVHCRQGIGRSSLVAAGIFRHLCPKSASEIFALIASSRGTSVPDTEEQSEWLERWTEMFF